MSTTTAPAASETGATTVIVPAAPAALRLPFELLREILNELPTPADVAAAALVCRFWASAGAAVLWRSPPERVLRQLPAAARRAHSAAHVAELSLASRSIARIVSTSLPRLTTLRVTLTVVLHNTQRFCRFVLEHSGGEESLRTGGRGRSAYAAHDNLGSGSGTEMTSYATTPMPSASVTARVLTKVCITTCHGTRTRTLPTEAFVVLASSPCLWHFEMAGTEVTMAAVHAALVETGVDAASGANDTSSGSISSLPQLQPRMNRHVQLFPSLRVLFIKLKHSVAMVLLPLLRADILTELCLKAIPDGSNASELLLTVALFTQLRRLTLHLDGIGSAQLSFDMGAGSNLRAIKRLQRLRALRLRDGWASAISDDELLDLVQDLPEMAVLSVGPSSRLSAKVLPALGARSPALEDVELAAELDTSSFKSYDVQTPILPNLGRLAMLKPAGGDNDHL